MVIEGLTDEEKEKYKVASCFVQKFIDYFKIKISEYESNVKPGYEIAKKSTVFNQISGNLGGAIVGAATFGATGSIAGFGIGKCFGEKFQNFAFKFQHKSKAKAVTAKKTTAVNEDPSCYDPLEHERILDEILIDAGLEIYRVFEPQIMHVWRKSIKEENTDRSVSKLASDSVDRVMNYLSGSDSAEFTPSHIAYGVIKGQSKPSGTKDKLALRFGSKGRTVPSEYNDSWNTAEMFETVLVLVNSRSENQNGIYSKSKKIDKKFGCRLLTFYEHDNFSEFIAHENYSNIGAPTVPDFPFISKELLCKLSNEIFNSLKKIDFEHRFTNVDKGIGDIRNVMKDILEGQKNFEKSSIIENKKHSFIPPPTPDKNFVERKQLMDKVIALLSNPQIPPFPIVVLFATGGYGKTQLSRAIGSRCSTIFNHVVWINSDLESNLRTGILNHIIASEGCSDEHHDLDKLRKNLENGPSSVLSHRLYSKLENEKLLLIFDNVQDYEMIKDYLPLNYKTGRFAVLITARQKWDTATIGVVENIQVKEFEKEESEDFIYKILGPSVDGIEHLVNASGGIPLILNIITMTMLKLNWIKNRGSIVPYLQKFNIPKILDHKNKEHSCQDSLRGSITFVLTKILEYEDNGKLAKVILDRIAYMDPACINLEKAVYKLPAVHKLAGEIVNSQNSTVEETINQVIRNSVNILADFALVSFGNYSTIKIHRLVQTVRRVDLKQEGKEEEILNELLGQLQNLSYYMINISDYQQMFTLWPLVSCYPLLVDKLFQLKSCLFALTYYGHTEIITKFLQYFPNAIDRILVDQDSPMLTAVKHGHNDIFNLFCKVIGQHSYTRYSNNLYEAAREAVYFKRLEMLKKLIEYFKIDVKIYQEGAKSLIHVAVNQNCDAKFIKYLIEKGADPECCDDKGFNVLHKAVFKKNLLKTCNAFESLLESKSGLLETRTKNKKSSTALMLCAEHGFLDCLKYLLVKKADIKAIDGDGESVLFYLFRSNRLDKFEALKLLLESGAEINIINNYGSSPLFLALQDWSAFPFGVESRIKETVILVKELLDNGADICHLENNGDSVLHIAVRSRCAGPDIFKLLAERKPELLNCRNLENQTPLELLVYLFSDFSHLIKNLWHLLTLEEPKRLKNIKDVIEKLNDTKPDGSPTDREEIL